jgi:IMP dehydrogenase/GMP reductase
MNPSPLLSELTLKGHLSQYFSGNEYLILLYQNGRRVKKYRGMGSLEAMTKGSDARYLGDTAKLKIAQGVVGAVSDKGSVLKFVPYTLQAVKQGFQDLGASSMQTAHDLLRRGVLRLEVWLSILYLYFFLWP